MAVKVREELPRKFERPLARTHSIGQAQSHDFT